MAGPYNSIDQVPEQKEGDRPSASLLNLLIQNAKRKLRISGPCVTHIQTKAYDIISIAQAGGADVRPFVLYEEREDILKCREWSFANNAIVSDAEVRLAKPYLLQTTPFDTNTIENADGENVAYAYTAVNERTLTFDGDSSDTEAQVIIAKYNPPHNGYHGDILWGIKVPSTGITYSGVPVLWLDLNLDGRHWAEDNS